METGVAMGSLKKSNELEVVINGLNGFLGLFSSYLLTLPTHKFYSALARSDNPASCRSAHPLSKDLGGSRGLI